MSEKEGGQPSLFLFPFSAMASGDEKDGRGRHVAKLGRKWEEGLATMNSRVRGDAPLRMRPRKCWLRTGRVGFHANETRASRGNAGAAAREPLTPGVNDLCLLGCVHLLFLAPQI